MRQNHIIRALTLRQLKLVSLLYELKSLHVAADELGVSRSAATKSLQKLELIFGTQLFLRTQRGLKPTRAGEIIIHYAQDTLIHTERASAEIDLLNSGMHGELRIGMPHSASGILMQQTLSQFTKLSPKTRIIVREKQNLDLITALSAMEIDLIVGREPDTIHLPGLGFEHLYDEIICVCVRPDHPLTQKSHITLEQIADEQWIIPSYDHSTSRRIENCFTASRLPFPRNYIASAFVNQYGSLLQNSDCIAAWPFQTIRASYLSGKLAILPVAMPHTLTKIGLTRRLRGKHNSFVADFIRLAKRNGKRISEYQSEWHRLFEL